MLSDLVTMLCGKGMVLNLLGLNDVTSNLSNTKFGKKSLLIV